ncbi:MAG: hypothetical protein J3Q66DRAFT_341646 [Benniella sp.]|nr:MAG: hypothetical protein J3Q66DRAFT_341646 [Benniella sp.]
MASFRGFFRILVEFFATIVGNVLQSPLAYDDLVQTGSPHLAGIRHPCLLVRRLGMGKVPPKVIWGPFPNWDLLEVRVGIGTRS